MELKRYKEKIANQLMQGLKGKAMREKAMEEGSDGSHYRIPKKEFDNWFRKMNEFKGITISMPGHVTTGHDCGGAMEDFEDEEDDDYDGGSFARNERIMRK